MDAQSKVIIGIQSRGSDDGTPEVMNADSDKKVVPTELGKQCTLGMLIVRQLKDIW